MTRALGMLVLGGVVGWLVPFPEAPPPDAPGVVSVRSTPTVRAGSQECRSPDVEALNARIALERKELAAARAEFHRAWGIPWERPVNWSSQEETRKLELALEPLGAFFVDVDCSLYPCSVLVASEGLSYDQLWETFGAEPDRGRMMFGGTTFLESATFVVPPAGGDPRWAENLKQRLQRPDRARFHELDEALAP